MLIAIKGAGDLATGIACRLHRCGFQIVCTDIEKPTTVRCTVAFSPCGVRWRRNGDRGHGPPGQRCCGCPPHHRGRGDPHSH